MNKLATSPIPCHNASAQFRTNSWRLMLAAAHNEDPAEALIELAGKESPDQLFEREWAASLLAEVRHFSSHFP